MDLVVELFDRLAYAGVTAILKIDHERAEAFNGRPWTLVISGPAVGNGSPVRAEERSFAR
jgi:hypothetical protein